MIREIIEKWTCKHDWEEKYLTNVYEFPTSKRPFKSRATLVCKKCGKIKQIDV